MEKQKKDACTVAELKNKNVSPFYASLNLHTINSNTNKNIQLELSRRQFVCIRRVFVYIYEELFLSPL